MVALADYLLLNHREFRELGQRAPADSDEDIAARLLEHVAGDRSVIVVKRRTGIQTWRREMGKALGSFYPQAVLADDQIEDATGAGDVFAAGLLAVLTGDRLQIELGAILGMTLARHKLRYVGSHGHAQLAQVTADFIRSVDAARRTAALPGGVFVAHGRNPEWLAVKAFVEQRFGVPVYSFESDAWGSRPVTEALSDYLQRCDFAICVLTAEDATSEGHRVARQNVIHEIGLFQGRCGFDRVLVLAEEGCEFIPAAVTPTPSPFRATPSTRRSGTSTARCGLRASSMREAMDAAATRTPLVISAPGSRSRHLGASPPPVQPLDLPAKSRAIASRFSFSDGVKCPAPP